MQNLPYDERILRLKIYILDTRRARQDLLSYKKIDIGELLTFSDHYFPRGHSHKL